MQFEIKFFLLFLNSIYDIGKICSSFSETNHIYGRHVTPEAIILHDFSSWRTEFDVREFHVRFVSDKAALGQLYCRVLTPSCARYYSTYVSYSYLFCIDRTCKRIEKTLALCV